MRQEPIMTQNDTQALAAAFASASPADQQALAETLAHEVAINAIYDQPPVLVEASKIYIIDEEWHAKEACTDGRFVVAKDMASLTCFLGDDTQEVAVAYRVEGLSLDALERLLERCPASKTVLFFAAA